MLVRFLFLLLLTGYCASASSASTPEPALTNSADAELHAIELQFKTDVAQSGERISQLLPQFEQLTPSQQSKLLILMAVSRLYAARFDEALTLLKRAEARTTDRGQLAQIFNFRATTFMALRRFQDALQTVQQTLNLLPKLDDAVKRDAYLRIADIYEKLDAFEEMERYARRMLALTSDSDIRDRCYAQFTLVNAEFHQSSQALPVLVEQVQSVKAYCQQQGFPLMVAMSNKLLGRLLLKQDDLASAEQYLQQALAQYQHFAFAVEITSTQALLAQVYLAAFRVKDAAEMAKMVVDAESSPMVYQPRKDAFEVLAKIAEQQQDYEQAVHYLQAYAQLSGLLYDERQLKATAYQAAKFQAQQQQEQLQQLSREREFYLANAALQEKAHHNMLLFISVLAVSVLLLAIMLMIGLQQKRRYMRLSRFDGMTGIYNRETGQRLGEERFIKALSCAQPYALVLFDLDKFKCINDNFGHATGDWVLRKVTEVLKAEVRNTHIFARFGGEEFAIIMPNTELETAAALAEQYRLLLAAINTSKSGHQFNVSASFGVSGCINTDLSLDPLINRADLALYRAKASGRNAVAIETGLTKPLTVAMMT
ncbi:hypothetical protein HR45_06545 [Shewanella mangrovi]|uniref:diguanylate cyclase n=1 Tax=Shewanella mangrovi TaxID=1515746 RepID=A0A094JFY1_9GAMM|nr:GGDEF domain-containing protein [Shewanella mangrovi]KFZ38157.1 hypothetical protein HR45_06545 [Shewanella mangrovi]